jgi:LysR family hydrogen peroxide-inducible transcriptional activator
MNLQQLEYIVAVDQYRHFAKAAEHCYVTQPTLSMMIKKLEEELDVIIFDRDQHPIAPTPEGLEVLRRARLILAESNALKDYTKGLKGELSGELRLAVIPTLAPYLLPLFIRSFTRKYPLLKLYIYEMVTDEIITKLRSGELDMGLLATPLGEQQLSEHVLFHESFFAYASQSEKLPAKKYLLPKEIDPDHLWLLEEGHCLRNQVFNLCELRKQSPEHNNLQYEAGSIETLINLVDKYNGVTIIPELALTNLNAAQKKKVREFSEPKPVREVSLVTTKTFPRKMILEKMKEEILSALPFDLHKGKRKVIGIGS